MFSTRLDNFQPCLSISNCCLQTLRVWKSLKLVVWERVNPLPDDILDASKLKEFADKYFKFDENGRKLSKRVEDTVEKGEIAHYEQFLLFPQCFQKACFRGTSKGVIVWEWVKTAAAEHWHPHAVI